MSRFVRYSPDVETVEPDEGRTVEKLEAQFRQILDTTSEDYGRGVRSVHAKAHAVARAHLRVHGELAPELAQGLFARAGDYDAVIRVSSNAGDILPDAIAAPRGLSLKVMGVEGERLPGSEGDATQDFIMVNGPVFAAPDPAAFLKTLTVLSKTTDRAEGAKKAMSAVLQVANKGLTAIGITSPLVNTLGGAPQVHPLGETYWSQTPFRYGDHIAKWQLIPVSDNLLAHQGEEIDIDGRADAVREEMDKALRQGGGVWELRVQLNLDLDAMPVEDPTVRWDEEKSPFRTVATLTVEPQAGWGTPDRARLDDLLSFNIWHGLAAHRPLGGVNRARNAPYRMSSRYRHSVNNCPMHEPASLADLEPAA